MKKRKFVIVGGGTSGWITAHTVRKYFPDDDITVVYSEKQGIIGVGESTTPHIIDFLNSIGVDLGHCLKAVSGTIKHGISFENWNGDNKKYMHPFVEHLSEFSNPPIFNHSCWELYNKLLINKKLPFDQYLYQTRLAYENKIDVKNTSFGFHFDAHKFAEYLKELAFFKNIKTVVGDVVSTDLKTNGNIETIHLEDGSIECDFVFDCTGFSKLLIGNLYKEEWISYKEHLPMNTAITFWTEEEDAVPSYTKCIAMTSGWAWKIPLQDRFGCGYVYDSNYINEEQAQQEAEKLFQQKLKVRKVIKFDPGRYRNAWVKNCIAVGLSSNFIEPLEATSIWLELALLANLKHFLNEIDNPNENSIKLFNQIIGNEVDEKMNFVYLHYMTKRNDSAFWKEFQKKHPMPERLKKLWPSIKENNLRHYQINDPMCPAQFPLMSYLWICNGLELFENGGDMTCYEKVEPNPEIYKLIIDMATERATDQKTFLKSL
jgi:flavin-dependent dehydrogenase